MSKFFLTGPVTVFPTKFPIPGLLSLPFFSLCVFNVMAGCRTICIESSFFTSYHHYSSVSNGTTKTNNDSIESIFATEYRLLVYLAPCTISFISNGLKLMYTTKGLKTFFVQYPQFLLAPCFTPFLFEGCKNNGTPNTNSIRVWKLGTIINALYIGCFPQFVLLFMEYYKGVPEWRSQPEILYEHNDGLFKHKYGNIAFAITSGITFFVLTLLFFCTNLMFDREEILNRIFNIICYSRKPKYTVNNKRDSNAISLGCIAHTENVVKATILENENNLNTSQETTQSNAEIYRSNSNDSVLLEKNSNAKTDVIIIKVNSTSNCSAKSPFYFLYCRKYIIFQNLIYSLKIKP